MRKNLQATLSFLTQNYQSVLNTPLCGNRVPPVFQLSFTIEETALTGSVVLNMTRLSGYSDPDVSRAVTFSSLFEVKGMYTPLRDLAHPRLSLGACATEFVHSLAVTNQVFYHQRHSYCLNDKFFQTCHVVSICPVRPTIG